MWAMTPLFSSDIVLLVSVVWVSLTPGQRGQVTRVTSSDLTKSRVNPSQKWGYFGGFLVDYIHCFVLYSI